MRVKICGVKDETELEIAVNAGADAIGFLVGQRYPSQDFILPEKAAWLTALLPPFVSPVLVTHLTDPGEIQELAEKTGITSIQLHGPSTPEQLGALRECLGPGVKLILAIHVGALPGEISPAPAPFEPLADAFLLDSFDPATGKVGGTGKTHHWETSAQIVNTVHRPVILAGGLNPDNVAEAVRTVRPYAVDANSALRPFGKLDARIAGAFVQNALRAFEPVQSVGAPA
ncbi:MAG: phosphoribosylanthranilate isomerase [Lentisphaeria bacterium]|nr:phosphoribosylanthranilate isomerase [Lentisphaeria bacterium]